MNCKPGDLAVIAQSKNNDWAIGRIVRVTTLTGEAEVWNLEEPFWHPNGKWRFTRIEDCCLKPIGNPGDDARDETLDWLPVPTKEIA
jgi:hypothetical protein